MKKFWKVILCLSVLVPQDVAHSLISDFWRGCRFSKVGGSRWVLSLFYMQASISWTWTGSQCREIKRGEQLMCFGNLPSPDHLERPTSEIGFKPAKLNPCDAQWWEGGQEDLRIQSQKWQIGPAEWELMIWNQLLQSARLQWLRVASCYTSF